MIKKTDFTDTINTTSLDRKVYIVILNHKGTLDTIECLESILKLNYLVLYFLIFFYHFINIKR